MTASLLARKGDAHPSSMPANLAHSGGWTSFKPAPPPPPHFDNSNTVSSVPPMNMRAAERDTHIRGAPPPVQDLRLQEVVAEPERPAKPREVKAEPAQIDKPRRLFVNLSPEEYERLGIVAVKQDSTRHQLLRDALEVFLKAVSHEYARNCACVSGTSCKGTCEA